MASRIRSLFLPAVWVATLVYVGWMSSLLASPPPVAQFGPLFTAAPGYSIHTVDGELRPVGYRQLTSLSSATSLPSIAGAELVLIQAEGQNLRVRDDGTSPTTSVGFQVFAGDSLWYNGANLTAVQLIEETASGKANLLFYGY